MNIANFTPEVYTDNQKDYYPEQKIVENIIKDDEGKLKIDPKVQQIIDLSVETGNIEYAEKLKRDYSSHPKKIIHFIIFLIVLTVALNRHS